MTGAMLNRHGSDQRPRRDQTHCSPDIARHAEIDKGNPNPPPATHSPAGYWEITLAGSLGIITAAGVVGGIVYLVVTAH